MNILPVKFKKLDPKAVAPYYSREGDAGLDFTALTVTNEDNLMVCTTGIAVEIPPGHVGLLFPRSGVSNKDLSLANSIGVVDSNYRGDVTFKFRVTPYTFEEDGVLNVARFREPNFYKVGERIGQMIIIPYPEVQLTEVDELSDSDRGANGFGSSGK